MQLLNVASYNSSALTDLDAFVDENDCARELRTLVIEDHPFLVTWARRIVDDRKEKIRADVMGLTPEKIIEAAENNGVEVAP